LTSTSFHDEYELPEAIEWFVDTGYTVRDVVNDGWNANVNTSEERDAVERRLRDA
jgi:dTDP-glucose pyrophosphorylase